MIRKLVVSVVVAVAAASLAFTVQAQASKRCPRPMPNTLFPKVFVLDASRHMSCAAARAGAVDLKRQIERRIQAQSPDMQPSFARVYGERFGCRWRDHGTYLTATCHKDRRWFRAGFGS